MFKYFGTVAQKFTFTVEVHDVVLPDMLENFDGTETLCVSLERKSKSVFTKDQAVLLNKHDEIIANFAEKLTADITLYKDSKTGKFKEKVAKVSVLQRKRGAAGLNNTKDAFKTIGIVNIPLHEIVVDENGELTSEEQDLQIHLLWCVTENAYINLTVSAVDKELLSETGSINTDEDEGNNSAAVAAQAPKANSTSAAGLSSIFGRGGNKASSQPTGPSIAEVDNESDSEVTKYNGNSKSMDKNNNMNGKDSYGRNNNNDKEDYNNMGGKQDKNVKNSKKSGSPRDKNAKDDGSNVSTGWSKYLEGNNLSASPSNVSQTSDNSYNNNNNNNNNNNYNNYNSNNNGNNNKGKDTRDNSRDNRDGRDDNRDRNVNNNNSNSNNNNSNGRDRESTRDRESRIEREKDNGFNSNSNGFNTSTPNKIPNSSTKPPLPPVPRSGGTTMPPKPLSAEDKKFEQSALFMEMRSKIANLESVILASEDIVAFERGRAQSAIDNNTQLNNSTMGDLRNQLLLAQEENKRTTDLLNEYSFNNNKVNEQLNRVQTQLNKALDELESVTAEKRKLEADNESILSDLITAKVTNGNLANDLEEARLEIHHLKQKMEAASRSQQRGSIGGGSGAPPGSSTGQKMNLDQRLAEHQRQQQQQQRPSQSNQPMQTPQRPAPSNNFAPQTAPQQRQSNSNNYDNDGSQTGQRRQNPLNNGGGGNGGNAGAPQNGGNRPQNAPPPRPQFASQPQQQSGNASGGNNIQNSLLRGFGSVADVGAGIGSSMMRGFGHNSNKDAPQQQQQQQNNDNNNRDNYDNSGRGGGNYNGNQQPRNKSYDDYY